MNAQHSCKTDEWYTPHDIVARARVVLGDIDLDPASSPEANKAIGARRILTREDDGLTSEWVGTLFINPPGGRILNRSLPGLFWAKLMDELNAGRIAHAVWIGFSLEQLAITQGYAARGLGEYMCCIPAKRLRFLNGGAPGGQPSHGNVIGYVPGNTDRSDQFIVNFYDIGTIINVRRA